MFLGLFARASPGAQPAPGKPAPHRDDGDPLTATVYTDVLNWMGMSVDGPLGGRFEPVGVMRS